MVTNIDRALGIHDDALIIRARRATILASNLANADTPNYKAQDLDFKNALREAAAGAKAAADFRLLRTHAGHLHVSTVRPHPEGISYRTPQQASLDGNTVDTDVERSEFTKNSLAYMVSLRFLGGKFKSILSAIKGE